ncbi:c2h2 transcription factor [Sporothrix brasiliensis 5110]|uniref:C2h2 transcription factor n=1 Tax=Sporothrix brasiliensis 5110 TaxID=1398154 RepID=A0A0C2J7P3_9PEZI|nr:c2h2 transcription factor [Sporothrix brasiliensis 5110]KIH95015.1 c2h2 transcription factor [Sporothrix brasiliensis 5110]
MLVAHHTTKQQPQQTFFNITDDNDSRQFDDLDPYSYHHKPAAVSPPRQQNSSRPGRRLSLTPSRALSPNFLDTSAAATAAQDPVLVAGLDSDTEFDLDFDFHILAGNDLMMQSDRWLPANHLAAGRSFGHPSFSHHRESSLSSLGSTSAGPASPFSQTTSNPHIAVSDSVGDSFANMSYYEDPSFPLVKQATAGVHDSLYGHQGHAPYTPSADNLSMPHGTYGNLLAANRQRAGVTSGHSERGLQPPPDLSMSSNRSQPVSVASSIASNSPATPSLDQADEEARRRNGERRFSPPPATGTAADDLLFLFDGGGENENENENDECSRFFNDIVAFHGPPKLDRTMTDVYNDELYSPNFAAMPTSAPSTNASHMAPTSQEMFAQRLQQINSQHLSAASHQSPVSTGTPRERSPFRQGSPMAPTPKHDFGTSPTSNLRFGAHQQQQHGLAGQDASGQAFRTRIARSQGTSTPQTISPKDAVLEYRDPDGEGDSTNYSLFSQGGQQSFTVDQMNKAVTNMGQSYATGMGSGVPAAPYNYMAPQLNQGLQLAQQYPFMAQHHGNSPMADSISTNHSPVPAIRSVTSLAALSEPVPGSQRPGIVNNDGGTYTCTYHGCTRRFETPALLQKHKREGHRQANALVGTRKTDSTAPQGLLNTQAGPHRCERINPSTGKPCNTVFSRPYDLTRHEDTIHNGRKQKVRCNLCTEEKTFSRADALTRHFRVCHPEVEFTGKHRKRGVHAT